MNVYVALMDYEYEPSQVYGIAADAETARMIAEAHGLAWVSGPMWRSVRPWEPIPPDDGSTAEWRAWFDYPGQHALVVQEWPVSGLAPKEGQ